MKRVTKNVKRETVNFVSHKKIYTSNLIFLRKDIL